MLDEKDKYWIWQEQKFDIEDKYWSYIGQGHSLDIGWTYVGQNLDIGQSLVKLLRTNIGKQHPSFLMPDAAKPINFRQLEYPRQSPQRQIWTNHQKIDSESETG